MEEKGKGSIQTQQKAEKKMGIWQHWGNAKGENKKRNKKKEKRSCPESFKEKKKERRKKKEGGEAE
jgi:hypothetical protein